MDGSLAANAAALSVDTDIPARLDRLPWAPFHWRIALALGITWVLDGLEVTLAGSLAGALAASPVLHLTTFEVGVSASAYLTGAMLGAIMAAANAMRVPRGRWLIAAVLPAAVCYIVVQAVAWYISSFVVKPNELVREKPYIVYNTELTRQAY